MEKIYSQAPEMLSNQESVENEPTIESIRPLTLSIDFDGDGPLEAYDIIDVFPHGEERDIPVCMFTGFGNQASDYVTALKTIAHSQERRTLAWEDRKGLDIGPVRYDREKDIPTTQLAKVLGTLEALRYLDAEKVDVVAHSEGSIHAVLAAYMYPEKFRKLVLVNPAGMTGGGGLTTLIKGALKEGIARSYKMVRGEQVEKKTEKSFTPDFVRHQLESILNISQSQIHHMLESLRENDEVEVTLVHTSDDRLFDFSDIEKVLQSGKTGNPADYVDKLHIAPEGGHSGLFQNSKVFAEHVLPFLGKGSLGSQEAV